MGIQASVVNLTLLYIWHIFPERVTLAETETVCLWEEHQDDPTRNLESE